MHRIDYILWPAQWQTGHVGTSVHYEVDISSGPIDHKLVTCTGMAAWGHFAPGRQVEVCAV